MRIIQVQSNHPVSVKKTQKSFDEVFDYMIKVANMTEAEKISHDNFDDQTLKRKLGLEYLNSLLITGEGLLTEVMMDEEEWSKD